MPAAVLRAVVAESWHRPGRQLLVGLVIAVATAFAAASVMLTGAASSTIVRELAGTPEAAALVVLPPVGAAAGSGIPLEVEELVRDTPGVAAVEPVGSGTVAASAPGFPGDGEAWTAASSFGGGGGLSRYPLTAGALPAGPGDAAISEDAARRTGMGPGDPLSLVGVGGVVEAFTVSGVVAVRGQALNTVVLDPDAAARLTDTDPSQLDVLPAAGAPVAELAAGLTDALDGRALVRDGADVRASELAAAFGGGGGIGGVFAALGVFGATAVLAAALTTFCVFGVVAARQRRTVVLLRGIGAGRGQVLRALLVDAAVVGLVAGVLGAVLSLGLVGIVRAGVRLGLGEELPAPGIPWTVLLAAVAGAVLITLLAAVGPATRVSGERPAAVVAPEVRSRRLGRRVMRALVALTLGSASVAAYLLSTAQVDPQQALVLVAVAGVLAFGAALAAGPMVLPGLAWLIGLLLTPLFRLPGRIAVRSALRAPDRASTTAATLVLASLLLSVVLVGLQSMTVSVEQRIAARFPAAVVALPVGQPTLPADLDRRLADLPETGAVARILSATMSTGDGTPLTFTAVDPATFPRLLDGAVDAGSLADLAPGTVALDRAQAAAWRVGPGSPLTFAGPGEAIELRVVAVYRSSGVLQPVTVHPTDLTRIVDDEATVAQVLADPAPGVGVDALRSAVAQAVGPDGGAQVVAPAEFRAELEDAVTLTRTVAFGLVGATVLVAVCGVAVALTLSVRERNRETSTLRALGMGPGQVVAALGLESALLGLAGVLVGTGLGVLFGVLSVFALREAVVVPVDSVLLGSGLLVVVAVVAGTLPAIGAARRRPLPAFAD